MTALLSDEGLFSSITTTGAGTLGGAARTGRDCTPGAGAQPHRPASVMAIETHGTIFIAAGSPLQACSSRRWPADA